MKTAECHDADPLRALCDAVDSRGDAVDSRAGTTYAIGSAVQGAINDPKGGMGWHTGRVVGNIDGSAITVRFDAGFQEIGGGIVASLDGIEETYRLPEDRNELRSIPPAGMVESSPPKDNRSQAAGVAGPAERDAAGRAEHPPRKRQKRGQAEGSAKECGGAGSSDAGWQAAGPSGTEELVGCNTEPQRAEPSGSSKAEWEGQVCF